MLCTPVAERWQHEGPVPVSVLGPLGSVTLGTTSGLLPPARSAAIWFLQQCLRPPAATGSPTHLGVLGDPVTQHV